MSEAIKPIDTNATVQTNNFWAVDAQLDDREIYNAEKQSEKFHQALSEASAESDSYSTKDKTARLALLVAQKNLSI